VGRRPRLWRSVIKELEAAEELTKNNTKMTLAMCVNYGGRAEMVDGVRQIAEKVAAGEIRPRDIRESTIAENLYDPGMPDVDLFLRPSGEKRTSNFLLWQSAYAEMIYQDKLFPDFTPEDLFAAIEEYARRDRRFGAVK
jgi:di-trans,poly-cis-decaprenylcistransferase